MRGKAPLASRSGAVHSTAPVLGGPRIGIGLDWCQTTESASSSGSLPSKIAGRQSISCEFRCSKVGVAGPAREAAAKACTVVLPARQADIPWRIGMTPSLLGEARHSTDPFNRRARSPRTAFREEWQRRLALEDGRGECPGARQSACRRCPGPPRGSRTRIQTRPTPKLRPRPCPPPPRGIPHRCLRSRKRPSWRP